MSQSSRQLKFPGQNLPETVVRTMDDDSELQVTTLISTQDSENVDLKPLDISSNETDTYVSSTNKEQTNNYCKESAKDDLCGNTNVNVCGGNMQRDDASNRNKVNKDKRFLKFSETKKVGAVHDGSHESEARDATKVMSDNWKISNEFHCTDGPSIQHSNIKETSKFCSTANYVEQEMNLGIGDFEMSSDDDFFIDPMVPVSSCRSSDALCHGSQDQGNSEDSQQSLDMDEKQHHHLSQTIASVKQENNSLPLSSVKSKSQLENKKEILNVPSTSTQKQKSLLSFAKKSNVKAGSTKSSLKQTDIGVFFGLKPLTKPVENKLTSAKSDVKASSSSQSSAVSHRPGSWRGRKYNRSDAKNIGSVSEGQSSGPGEDTSLPRSKKSCPFYKKIPDSAITVDAFRYGDIPGCRAYFLSHFHYDHYGGLSGKFTNPVYCSKVS